MLVRPTVSNRDVGNNARKSGYDVRLQAAPSRTAMHRHRDMHRAPVVVGSVDR
jgi:hypothetical protein